MEWTLALILLMGLLCLFMASGMPVAFAFFGVNVEGPSCLWAVKPD